MKDYKYVYHASNTGGLTHIEPRKSTHKQPWVYATKDIATSALFLGEWFDFINEVGTSNGITWVFERFDGALEHAYKNKSGFIYKLPAQTFMGGKTQWSSEVVSTEVVNVIEETTVENTLNYLYELEKKGKIKIYRYPDVPEGYSNDKNDIIQKAVVWTLDYGEKYLDLIEQYHPDILAVVVDKLKSNNYSPKTTKWKEKFKLTITLSIDI